MIRRMGKHERPTQVAPSARGLLQGDSHNHTHSATSLTLSNEGFITVTTTAATNTANTAILLDCATSRKATGSIPDSVIAIFH
jgi:hypothetical protein